MSKVYTTSLSDRFLIKALVCHLSSEPMSAIHNLKKNYMTNKPKDEQAQGRTGIGMNTVRWQSVPCIIAPMEFNNTSKD